jgi:exopolysaccharide biosynthesis polyprenyl glycosylphosphotransferase
MTVSGAVTDLMSSPRVAEDLSRVGPASNGVGGSAFRRTALSADVLLLALAALVVHLLSPTGSPTGAVPREPLAWSLAFSATAVAVLYLRGSYSPLRRLDLLEALRVVLTGTALAAVLTMSARVLLANDAYVAAETVRHWLVVLPLLGGGRAVLLSRETRARRAGRNTVPTLIVGAGRIGRLAARRLLDEPELGLRPVAFLDDDPLEPLNDRAPRLPVIGFHDLDRVLSGVRQVIVTYSRAGHEELLDLSRRALRAGARVAVVPRLFELEGERVTTEHLGGLPLVELRPSDPDGWRYRAKYGMDRAFAGIGLLLVLPVVALSALAILLSMGRPVLFRQRRIGRDGHEFEMLKLRTLEPAAQDGSEADADWIAEQLGDDAPGERLGRDLTPVGAFLRRYSLDELPQLWNVIRGDMSLVGPRPERVTPARRFERSIYRYGDRHRVKSGLTGWAQVNGLRGKTPLADRVEWDNHYIENWTPWLDFKILMRTVGAVLRGARLSEADGSR